MVVFQVALFSCTLSVFYAQIGFFFIGCTRDRESGLCVPLLFYLVVFWVCHLKEEACEGLASVFLECICDVFIISDVFFCFAQ